MARICLVTRFCWCAQITTRQRRRRCHLVQKPCVTKKWTFHTFAHSSLQSLLDWIIDWLTDWLICLTDSVLIDWLIDLFFIYLYISLYACVYSVYCRPLYLVASATVTTSMLHSSWKAAGFTRRLGHWTQRMFIMLNRIYMNLWIFNAIYGLSGLCMQFSLLPSPEKLVVSANQIKSVPI